MLYGKDTGDQYSADGTETDEWATWQKPKTKREGLVNVVKTNYHGNCKEIRDVMIRNCSIYPDEESAKEWAIHCGDVISTVKITWEE